MIAQASAAGSANAVRDLAFTTIARKTEIVYRQAFQWLVAVASVASLQSWAGSWLFTYIRWHKGTEYVEKSCAEMSPEDAQAVREQIKVIKKNRSWGQPYLAYYAFWPMHSCAVHEWMRLENWYGPLVHERTVQGLTSSTADVIGDDVPQYDASQKESNPVSQFLSAYVPILIKQTRMLSLDEMVFDRGTVPPLNADPERPKNPLERFLQWLRII
ncbi:hypothetical protein NUW54_g12366 [Trametes sanguinea]|uniref:Uncharacterized protein n=1 Tax=Trametes sanguinea TaxID=158606 RepID=A0ACC1MZ29_9APHY|nr:hypothetical protein NUW54_g12366 [Trametes sanguinea]